MTPGDEPRYVVWVPGPPDRQLPSAASLPCRYGGHRIMHELAVAIAATGRRVEMRGGVDRSVLDPIAEAAGGAMPELPRTARRPTAHDVVFISEGQYPLTIAHIALSPAHVIMLLLAPPGLFGWPFVGGWSLPDPKEVEIDAVARPEHFRAMAAIGLELWTHSGGLLERIEAAGVMGTLIGTGNPIPFPQPLPKRYDVVTLADNRWAELARSVVTRLDPSVVHHEIPSVSNAEVLRTLGQARILVHPLRIEGHSNVGQEARVMGAVPVVLDSNPFSVGLDDAGGAVAASTLDEMAEAVTLLLQDRQRLEKLRKRAMATAREQVDWNSYVKRIDAALLRPAPSDPARGARAVMGDALMAREAEMTREFTAQIRDLRDELSHMRRAYDDLASDRDAVLAHIESIKRTRAWRMASRYRRLRSSLRRGHPPYPPL